MTRSQIDNIPIKRPASLEAFATAIREAREGGMRVRVAGSGSLPLTVFSADPRPVQTISTTRMNKMLEHAVGDMTVIVQAGMTLEALQRELAWRNQWLPVDPPIGAFPARAPGSRTVGGLIASQSLGPLRFGCGDWRLLILGMRWIDASGQIIRGGGRTVKNVAGYSTPRMMIGSCGSLGAIAEVTLRTFARPADERCVLFYCEDAVRAEALLAQIFASPTTLAYLQVIGGGTFTDNPLQLPVPDGGMVIVAGFLGREDICAVQIETLRQLPAARGLETISHGTALSGRLRLWMTTETASGPSVAFRLFATSSQVPALIREISVIAGPGAWVVSEAGSGVIRGGFSNANPCDALRELAGRTGTKLLWTRGPQHLNPAANALGQRLKKSLDPSGLWGDGPG